MHVVRGLQGLPEGVFVKAKGKRTCHAESVEASVNRL